MDDNFRRNIIFNIVLNSYRYWTFAFHPEDGHREPSRADLSFSLKNVFKYPNHPVIARNRSPKKKKKKKTVPHLFSRRMDPIRFLPSHNLNIIKSISPSTTINAHRGIESSGRLIIVRNGLTFRKGRRYSSRIWPLCSAIFSAGQKPFPSRCVDGAPNGSARSRNTRCAIISISRATR